MQLIIVLIQLWLLLETRTLTAGLFFKKVSQLAIQK